MEATVAAASVAAATVEVLGAGEAPAVPAVPLATMSTSSSNTSEADADLVGSDDDREYIPGTFEGPEKTMEVVFRPTMGREGGLRLLSRAQLNVLCKAAKCTILSQISNGHMDAYVLSESSLFVYRHRLIMKTCGTTTLLRCLSTLLTYADELGMELSWVGYSRKNLLFPNAQLWPHSNFGDEITYLNTHEKLQDRLRGSGHILGPVTGDHWFVYVADHDPIMTPLGSTPSASAVVAPPAAPAPPSTERTLNMMMFDMAPEVAGIFFQSAFSTGREMTIKAGIDHLCPGATIDETAFSPCGYSMNAILHDAYSTIHITPEPECSYASFETNTCLRSYSAMVRNVLSVFRPKRFVLTMFGDESALRSLPELPTDPRKIVVAGQGGFTRTSLSSSNVDTELCCLMACYTLTEGPSLSSTSSGLSLACASADGVDSKIEGAENRGGAAGIVMGTHGFGGSKEMIGQRERTFSLV